MAAAGAAAGGIWACVAPSIHAAVVVTESGRRVRLPVGNEADHYFDAATMMIGLLLGLAIVSAVLVWQWRQHRGPAMVVALTAGGVAAALTAAGVGAGIVRLRYGHTDIEEIADDQKIHYFIEAPSVFFGHTVPQILTVVLLPAAVAVLTYALIAAASAYDDLGVGPPERETVG
jgi:hypothetical protein